MGHVAWERLFYFTCCYYLAHDAVVVLRVYIMLSALSVYILTDCNCCLSMNLH